MNGDSAAKGTSPYTDEEMRLECARLAAVFSGGGDLIDNTERLYRFIRAERENEEA